MISSSNNPGLRTLAALIQIEFEDLYLKYGQSQPPRIGLHASSLLVSDSEWCTRKHVLAAVFSDEAVTPELARWQWKQQDTFLHGWELHRKWQYLFKEFGAVVKYIGEDEEGWPLAPEWELDRTHYDDTRMVYFSPDAILEFAGEKLVVEIKGINHDSFQALTNNLGQARKACETVDKAVVQAQVYMHLLELNHAVILIEDKNDQNFRVWIIEYDRMVVLPYIQRAYRVKGMLAHAKHRNQYPKRVCQTIDDPLARKCPMCDCCFSEKLEG